MAAGGVLLTGASPGRVRPCIISETSPKPRTKAIKTPISGMVLLRDRLRARVPGTSTGSRSGIVIIRYPPMRPLKGTVRVSNSLRRAFSYLSPLRKVRRKTWRPDHKGSQLFVEFPPFDLFVLISFQLHSTSNVSDG